MLASANIELSHSHCYLLEKMLPTQSSQNPTATRKKHGVHYTPSFMSNFMAQSILEELQPSKEHSKLTIYDPAAGEGELLLRFIECAKERGFSKFNIVATDIDLDALMTARKRLSAIDKDAEITLHVIDFMDYIKSSNLKADVVIMNPPYVRNSNLNYKTQSDLTDQFGITGHVDIYQGFLLGVAKILAEDGVVCSITSNRFMTTKSSSDFRRQLNKQFSIKGVWDFGDTRVFDAAVLPVVMLYKHAEKLSTNRNIPFKSYYRAKTANPSSHANTVVDCKEDGFHMVERRTIEVKSGQLDLDASPEVWVMSNNETNKWLAIVNEHSAAKFADVGKIRVGIKSNADKIFIKAEWEKEIGYIPELVRPLITHHAGGRFKGEPPCRFVLYPYLVENNKKITAPIDDYPLSKKYLSKHREALAKRKYLIKAGKPWYEHWVSQDATRWEQEKIVFRDIVEKPTFWFDDSGAVVNGDCYWMCVEDNLGQPDIIWLIIAIANASFIETYYDLVFNNKLYGNKRRFVTQYVEKFPLPDPKGAHSEKLIKLAKLRSKTSDPSTQAELELEIDFLVHAAFGVEKQEKK